MSNVLELSRVNKSYGNKKVLDNISFSVPEGSFFALLGLNGAGKTTLINILASLCYRDNGTVNVLGYDLDRDSFAIRREMGLMPQEFNLLPFGTVRETLVYHLWYFGLSTKVYQEWMDYLVHSLDLASKLDVQVYKLSGGMKRRLMMARALITRPKLALLDEPTAGVDIDVRQSIYAFLEEINKSGTSIILTTHYLEEANDLCNNYVLMSNGRVVREGLITDIRENMPLTFKLVFKDIPANLVLPQGLERVGSDQIDVTSDRSNLSQLFAYFNEQGLEILQIEQKSQLEAYFLQHAGRQNTEQSA